MEHLRQIEPIPGYEPEIGGWLWALEEARRRTLRLVDRLDNRILDWAGPDGRENAIGTLLYHLALSELEWLYIGIHGEQTLPQNLHKDFPQPSEDAEGRHTRVLGVTLETHLSRLERSRATFLEAFRGMSLDEWRHPRRPGDRTDYAVTPEWVVFHLVEHEAGHAFQMSSLKARASRLFA